MIQGESSATVILGSFHLNCCKEQFFHDKQIASVPQNHLVGRWGGWAPPPSPSTALPAPGPESSSTQNLGRRGRMPNGDRDGQGPGGIHAGIRHGAPRSPPPTPQGEFSPRAAAYSFEVKRLFEIKNQRKPLPNRLPTGVLQSQGHLLKKRKSSGFFTCEPGLRRAGGVGRFDCTGNNYGNPWLPARLVPTPPRYARSRWGGCPGKLWGCPAPHV